MQTFATIFMLLLRKGQLTGSADHVKTSSPQCKVTGSLRDGFPSTLPIMPKGCREE